MNAVKPEYLATNWKVGIKIITVWIRYMSVNHRQNVDWAHKTHTQTHTHTHTDIYSNCGRVVDGVLHLIQINHQPDATVFQFIILTFVYEGKTRGCHCSHWAPDDGRKNARNMLSCKQTSGLWTEKLWHQVGDLFELYDDARIYKP